MCSRTQWGLVHGFDSFGGKTEVVPGTLSDSLARDLALLPIRRCPSEIGVPGELTESFAIGQVMTVCITYPNGRAVSPPGRSLDGDEEVRQQPSRGVIGQGGGPPPVLKHGYPGCHGCVSPPRTTAFGRGARSVTPRRRSFFAFGSGAAETTVQRQRQGRDVV